MDNISQVKFAGNRLDLVNHVNLHYHDFNKLPVRDINIYKVARRSLSIITSSEYTSKEINVYLDMCSGSRSDTEVTVTALKALVQPQNGLLSVLQNGEEVQYTATMNEFNITWHGPRADVEIVFLASNPIGETVDVDTIAVLNGVTASNTSVTFTVDGSSNAEPVIILNINSVTGGTGASIALFNAKNNQGITLTENFSAGDVIEVDSRNYTVELNGTSIDYTGIFPIFAPGAQQLAYSDTFTTRNVDVAVTARKRFV